MRLWLISDTHTKQRDIDIPDEIDMIICAGDVGLVREPAINANQVLDFIEWFKSLTHIKYKVWVGGNHDTSLEHHLVVPSTNNGIVYLKHEMKNVGGLNIFGSPYTPEFGFGWAFNVPRQRLKDYWADIPYNADIVVTHGPPRGISDFAISYENYEGVIVGKRVGCVHLMNRIKEVEPKLHVFGHVHEDAGQLTEIVGLKTRFVNAAVLNLDYDVINNGIILDI